MRQCALKLDPWQRYTPLPLHKYFIEMGAYAVGMSIPPRAIYKAVFFVWGGGGCNVAKGLISREITKNETDPNACY